MTYLLHGAAGSRDDWGELIPLLGITEASSIDLYSNEESSLDEFAASLNEMSSEGDVLIGYSMGGRLALHTLLGRDCKWSRVVIISAHPGLNDPADRIRRVRADQRWAQLMVDDWAEFVDQWMEQPVFGGRENPWSRALPIAPARKIQRCFTCWSLGNQRDLLGQLAKVEIPVLWISGEEDRKYSDIAKAAVSRIAAAQLAIIPGAGHRCPWDKPELTADVIRGFLSP
ncbi:MAG: alpha/beta fold hydrolase [Verrucomicrobiaceae bacterium]|nr:alpha/beta fold hydrolase [Verrucomicrobiaceae bacterium]